MLVEIGCSHVLGHLNNPVREWGSLCHMKLESPEESTENLAHRYTGRSDYPLASRAAMLVHSPYFSIVSYMFYLCVCVQCYSSVALSSVNSIYTVPWKVR